MTSSVGDHPTFEFGSFRLDPAERLLVRDNRPVPLTPKAFDLLVYLVERRGRLVEKRVLLSALWPDAAVEEANLAYNVSALRKVLDEGSDGQSIIQTVPTRGYRFIGPVTTIVPSAGSASHRRSWWRLAWMAALVVVLMMFGVAAWLVRGSRSAPAATEGRPHDDAVRLTRLAVGPPELPMQSAAISPDGKYLAYASPAGIHVHVIDSGETRRISDARGTAVFGWTADSSRIRVFDSAHIAWDIALIGGAWQRSGLRVTQDFLSMAPDGSCWLSFNQEHALCVNPMQGAGRAVLRIRPEEAVSSVTWTPDAQRVYFTRGDGARVETFAVQSGGSSVAFEPESDEMIRFVGPATADGRLLVLIGSRRRSNQTSLREIRVDAHTGMALGRPRFLTDWREENVCLHVSASADATRALFMTGTPQSAAYVADFDEPAGRIDSPQRLTLNGANDLYPLAWLPDNQSVVFSSTVSGLHGDHTVISKQDIRTGDAAPLVTVDGRINTVNVSPDGRWLLFLNWRGPVLDTLGPDAPETHMRIMRTPVEGGMAEEIGATTGWGIAHCASVSRCVLIDVHDVYELDAAKGRGALVGTLPRWSAAANVSADGSEFHYVPGPKEPRNRIHAASLVRKPDRDIVVRDATNLGSLDTLRDGSGWLAANYDPGRDGNQLLYITMDGRSRVLWAPSGFNIEYAIPSRDGKHVAIQTNAVKFDAWMLTGLR